MLSAALLSFGVVFLAELGDRSQLITMTYALKYRWWVVLTGVGIAACVAHGVSVAVGHFLGLTLPARPMAFAAAIAFLVFAAWSWREGTSADGDVRPVREPRFALLAVVSSFLLAESGDKTTLATVALASDKDWAGEGGVTAHRLKARHTADSKAPNWDVVDGGWLPAASGARPTTPRAALGCCGANDGPHNSLGASCENAA